jgi:hypothetical protein
VTILRENSAPLDTPSFLRAGPLTLSLLEQKRVFEETKWEDLPACERFRWAFILRDMKEEERRRREAKREAAQRGRAANKTERIVEDYLDELVL